MPIFGGVVVRLEDGVVLCQTVVAPEPAADGSAAAVAAAGPSAVAWATLIGKCNAPNARTTALLDATAPPAAQLQYHVLSDSDVALAILSDGQLTRRHGHAVLDECARLFAKMFVEGPAKLKPQQIDVFAKPFADILRKYAADPSAAGDEKVRRVKQSVAEVKELALDNVERVLARGQHIDEIVAATDDLQSQAQGFQRNARALRQQLWWNTMKGRLILGGVVLVILFIIYLVFCGGISCSSK